MEQEIIEWQLYLLADHASTTVYRYGSAIRRFLRWYETEERRPCTSSALTPIVLVGYRNAIQLTEATSTVNTHVSALKSWCGWLHQNGYVEEDSGRRLKLVSRQAPSSPRSLKLPQVNALLRAVSKSRHSARDTAIVQILLQTGMRIGECARLIWEDFEFGEKNGKVLIRAGKGNKARSVPLNTSARQALAEYIAPLLGVVPSLKAVAAAWPKPKSAVAPNYFWQSQKGGRLSASAMGRTIDNIVRETAARELTPSDTSAHTLRHTFAKHYLSVHPGDLVGLATILGHASIQTTRIYVEPTAEELADRVEQLSLNAYS